MIYQPILCASCSKNPASREMITLCQRHVCIPCATAIAEALPLLKTQPCRRQTICMRLHECGIRISPADKRLFELVEYGVTDEQIRGACDIAKESTGSINLGYVIAILRNERERGIKYVTGTPKAVHDTGAEAPAFVLKPKEDWERLGFVSQADYEAWQFAHDQEYRRGRRISQAESIRMWMGVA